MSSQKQYRSDAGRGQHPYAQGFYAGMDKKDLQKNPYDEKAEGAAHLDWLDGIICWLECCEAQTYEDDRL